MKRKIVFSILTTMSLILSLFSYVKFTNASLTNLTITSVPSFPGQMEGSCFTINGTLFAGDTLYNLYRSDNNGSTFKKIYTFPGQPNPVDNDLAGYLITVYADSRNTMFVSIPETNRLYRSTDFGSTFTQVLNTNGTQNDGFYLGITEDAQGNLYVSTYCNSIYPTLPQVFKSLDDGITWKSIFSVQAEHIHNIAFNSYNNYLYVVVGEWAGTPYNNNDCESVWRSKDYGQTWTKIITRTNPNGYGDTIYWAVVFDKNSVYFGTDQAYRINWVARIVDDGSNQLFTPQVVYTFPAYDGDLPIMAGVKLNDTIIFSNGPEFYGGTSHIVATKDGVNWENIQSFDAPLALHHTNTLTKNPDGMVFGSSGPNQAYIITQNPNPSPEPTPSPTPTPAPGSAIVFADDFSSGNFRQWTNTYLSAGASQDVTNGVANFYTPKGANGISSCIEKQSFASTQSSVITASGDFYMPAVPTGFTRGNGAIFFLYLSDVTGNGNLNVGIDGSKVWGLYVGGYPIYNYVFQTSGAAPTGNTWYHLDLTADNLHQRVTLAVNGTTVINVGQQQFTDKTHTMELITGIGEDWCNDGKTHQLSVDNIVLDISDGTAPTPTPTPTPTVTPSPTASPSPTPNPTATPSPTPTPTSTPSPTPTPTPPPNAPLTNALQIKANVTVTSVNYQTSARLYVTITKNGTNQIEATIAKTTLPNITNLRFYINNAQKPFTYTDNGNSWTATVITT